MLKKKVSHLQGQRSMVSSRASSVASSRSEERNRRSIKDIEAKRKADAQQTQEDFEKVV